MILFHAFDSSDAGAPRGAGITCCDYARARAVKQYFEPLAQRASNLGLHCKIVVRPGAAAEQILAVLRAHPLGKDAARIGTVTAEHKRMLVARTAMGANRVIPIQIGEQLPRIC